jgi:hypothetical protein
MTPYSIACKRGSDRSTMLVELLDPATDLAAEGVEDDDEDSTEEEDDEPDGAAGGGRARWGGGASGRSSDGDDGAVCWGRWGRLGGLREEVEAGAGRAEGAGVWFKKSG